MTLFSQLGNGLAALRALRQDIHAHPEAAFRETRTARVVALRLRAAGIETHEAVGGTGVVGVLRGDLPDTGQSIALRADMDALRMDEATGLPYASCQAGVFHGCGHDGHTTMLIGAAEYLAVHRNFAGTVVFVFQPAEESIAGAAAMLADGLLKRFPFSEIYALHNAPHLPLGQIALKPGVMLAAGDSFEIRVKGKGGHGARPQETIDPIVCLAQLLVAAQSIVSRNIDPMDVAVLSFGKIAAGEAGNVIPASAYAAGTLRSYKESTRQLLKKRLQDLCTGMALASHSQIELDFPIGCPATVNHPEQTAVALAVAHELLGAEKVSSDFPAIMAGEDFAVFLQQIPGCYLFLGQGGVECHNPGYDFNDDILPIGIAFFVRLVERRLSAAAQQ
ncbi:amidohydrolase [Paucibacter sp. KBW04]|uniref:amidohydrolase n=1 Tax=Paucibacter sp. KBW04 TaxID=2153361 RepID=UPI000F566D63|nr:amidohydrolase [Paucibacter sp. KBW04]RQO59875.1 amidohydrolase [Paucibacter sp. KBW04]